MSFTLAPMGGLGNRLQAILSYRAKHGQIDCVWSHTFQVGGGAWGDTFDPLDGVTFRDSDVIIHHDGGPKVVDGVTYDNHACCRIDPQWYRELRLAADAKQRVCAQHLDAAIHVRRTDFADLKLALTTDAAFESFIQARTNERGRVYIATDNATTQNYYRSACIEMRREPQVQAVIQAHDELGHDQRATTMTFAAVDMFTCAKAMAFMGTRGSSFTATIEILRSLR